MNIGKGTTIGHATAQAGPFTISGSLKVIDPPAETVEKAEVTAFSDSTNQYIPTYQEGGEADFEIYYATAVTAVLRPLIGTMLWWQITYPDTHTETFQGFIDSYKGQIPMKQGITEKVKIKVTGVSVYA